MKNFINRFMLLATIMTFAVACGKNSSGGGGNHATPDLPGGGVTAQTGKDVKSIEELRNIFQAKNMDEALSPGMPIFHTGPVYSNGTSTSFGFEAGFCAQFLSWSWGDCYTQQEIASAQYLASVNQSIANGKFNVVTKAFSDSVQIEQIVEFLDANLSVQNARYVTNVLSRSNTPFYNEMLGLSQSSSMFGSTSTYRITSARVEMENGQTIEAYLVESFNNNTSGFYGYQSTVPRKFIVSPQLAIIANPVAVIDTNYYGQSQFVGALKSVGGVRVKSISATTSVMNANGQITNGQQIRL